MQSSNIHGQDDRRRERVETLRSVLGDEVAEERLNEILDASNGSVEHAVEIYFHQSPSQSQKDSAMHEPTVSGTYLSSKPSYVTSEAARPSNKRKGRSATPPSTPEKKANNLSVSRRVSSLSSPGKMMKSPIKQSRLESFFTPPKGRSPDNATTSKEISDFTTQGKTPTPSEKTHRKSDVDFTNDTDPPPMQAANLVSTKPISANRTDPPPDQHHVSFERFAEMLQQLADTTKRNIKLSTLESFIREIIDAPQSVENLSSRAESLTSALELVLGGRSTKPLNISGSAVSKAIQLSLGVSRNQISKAYRQYGDLGDCAASFFQKKTFFVTSSRTLSIVQVAQGMERICVTDGRDAKQHIVLGMLRGCQSKTEIRFLVRLLISNMRVGASLKSVLAALAMAVLSKDPISERAQEEERTAITEVKDVIALVQKTHDICPSLSKIVMALLEGGFPQMQRECSIQVHIPIAPMLAHPIHALEEIQKAMNTSNSAAVMEYKYDGMRLQAHYDGESVKLFSRHMLETTSQFSEVVGYLIEAFQTKREEVSTNRCSFIIDAEVVGVEGEGDTFRLLPFQDLSTRRKKNNDGNGVRVKIFAFDFMFLDGASLINESLEIRRRRLEERFKETRNFAFVQHQLLTTFDISKITEFLQQSIEDGAEGLMIKMLSADTSYEAGTRSHSWLKVKRDYVAGFSDTIDVVPIGAWFGSGRKAQMSFLSPVLLAVYDDQEDVFRSISRCMSFTDAMYESMREFYFRGTPYADDFSEDAVKLEHISEIDGKVVDNDDDNDNSSRDEDDESASKYYFNDGMESSSEARVNCFPSRPSSAIVVTNESPSIWFKPLEVFEVSFADLSLSRQHTAAAGLVDEEGRGIALRFPRFKRRRPDKKPKQATTSIEIAQLFSKQSKINGVCRSN